MALAPWTTARAQRLTARELSAGVLGTVLTQEFGLDRLSLPAALSSAFLGMFVGATALGRFADRYGRRTAFMLNLGIYSGFTLAGAFSTNATTLIVSRFLAGVGIGAELPLVDAYLSELLPSRLRGRYTAWAYTLGFVGIPAAGLLGRVLVPLEPFGVDGWRWLFVIGSLGALIVWLLRSRLPESPRWLASVGRDLEADAIVTRMEQEANIHCAIATGPAEAGPHVQDPNPPDSVAIVQPRWLATFSGAYRPRVIMLGVFHIFQTIGYYGGSTPTMAIVKSSPVVNQGFSFGTGGPDQRGMTRPFAYPGFPPLTGVGIRVNLLVSARFAHLPLSKASACPRLISSSASGGGPSGNSVSRPSWTSVHRSVGCAFWYGR